MRPLLNRMNSAAGLGVDFHHREALGIAGPLIGEDKQVRPILDGDRLLFGSLRRLHVNAQLGLDALLIVDLLDPHEGVVGRALGRGAGHHDLLDQLQLEGPHRVQPVDQVVGIAVRGGVAQGAQWIERLDGLLGLVGGIDALRLVDDDDGPGRLHELNGLAARELVAFLVNDVALLLFLGAGEVLAEGVDIDDQDLQRVAGGELPQPIDLLGVVHEMLEGQVVVERPEVLGGDFDVLEHALPEWPRWAPR